MTDVDAEIIAGSTSEADTPVRYIKLGPNGRWARRCFDEGVIEYGQHEIPEDFLRNPDHAAITAHGVSQGWPPAVAKHSANQLVAFLPLPPEGIWITFEEGRLWWAHAEPEVTVLTPAGQIGAVCGVLSRKALGGWKNTDALGQPLVAAGLSTRLTKVAGYRRTICRVEASEYLLRKLRGQEDPLIARAARSRAEMVEAASAVIGVLHWADFETLVDLILARSGWHRVSALGGTQKDADLIVEQTITGETALVQVKSSASQLVLDDYIGRLDAGGNHDRLIFACHAAKTVLDPRGRDDVIVWDRTGIADAVIRNGLFDWLIARAG